jgi:hypothetical protein
MALSWLGGGERERAGESSDRDNKDGREEKRSKNKKRKKGAGF